MSAPVTAAPPGVGAGSAGALEVARKLEEAAARPELADRRPQLAALGAALVDRDRAEGWQSVPLHTALGYPLPEPGEAGAGGLRWLDGVRVALVFVPVAVTWAGVSWAGALYRQELAVDPDLGPQSFFRLWLSGFDGRMWLSFDRMALIVAIVVLLIIGLTAGMEYYRARFQAVAAQRRHRLHAELNGLLTEATVHLARGQADAPERFRDVLSRTAAELAELVTQVRGAASEATTAMRAAGEAAAAVEGATTAVRESTDQAHQGVTRLSGSVDMLTEAVDRTGTATSRLVGDAIARGDAAAADLAAAVDNAVRGLDDAVSGLVQAVAGLHEAIDQVGARQDEHRDQLGLRLEEHERQYRELLPELVDRMADAQARALQAHLADLRTAVDNLARTQAELVRLLRRRPVPAGTVPVAPRGWFRRFWRRIGG